MNVEWGEGHWTRGGMLNGEKDIELEEERWMGRGTCEMQKTNLEDDGGLNWFAKGSQDLNGH